MIVFEFDSVEQAKAWYNDPEYQAIVGDLLASGKAMLAVAHGFTVPTTDSVDDDTARSEVVCDFEDLDGGEFYDTPALSQTTGATVGNVVVTGNPDNAWCVTSAPVTSTGDPGNSSGWFAGADQAVPVAQVVLDLSKAVRSFGASFLHYNQAGVNCTDPARLRVFSGAGGDGGLVGEVVSSGGNGVIDFAAILAPEAVIQSAIIDSPAEKTYCVTGYSVLI